PRAPEDHDRRLRGRGGGEELLLGVAACVDETAELPVVEGRAGVREPRAHRVRERQVHVVAAEEDVIADGLALEHERAVLVADRTDGRVPPAPPRPPHPPPPTPTPPAPPPAVDRRRASPPSCVSSRRGPPPSPACSAARRVRSRAAASNDAGTARCTSCSASG